MSDFAKSFFSFAKQKSNTTTTTTTSQQQSNNDNSSLNLTPVTSNATTRSNGLGFPTDIIPHTATPTIALSDNSFAMGTTLNRPITLQQQTSNLTAQLTNNNNNNSTKSGMSDTSSTYSNSTATLSNTNGTANGNGKLPHQQSSIAIPNQQQQQPLGITSTNCGIPEVDIPRGKLRVTVVEAVGLNVESSSSAPYVVYQIQTILNSLILIKEDH
ncbi:unnamed protein product [Ambrosiozyma monospora]|uniref:Unnamed protein product n=1 Tax=Ambrosiozyma monospora TaxID=43982 RepID=A0ACB5UC70_AMBMO|nr:unnamed protein product [Ambrosiozyma monospora]